MAEILGQHREGLEVKGESLVVRLGLDARRYARELPGWLVVEARGDLLILSQKGLAKLGIRQEAPFLERLRRLFRR